MKDNMKSMNLYIMIFITSLLLRACGKSDPMPPDPTEMEQDTVFEMIWTTRLDFNKEIVGTDNTQQYKDWLLVGGDLDFPPTIMAFNKDSGEKDWELVFDQLSGGEIDYMFRCENLLLARNGHHVFAINLESKNLVWNIDLKAMGMRLGRMTLSSNNKLYLEADFAWQSGFQVQHLYEIEVNSGDYKMVYSNPQDSIGIKSISPPSYVLIDNKDILVLNEYPNADLPPEEDKQNIIAIDLTSENIIWNTENFTQNFYSNSLHPPIIYDDRLVITGGDWSIYAFDVYTGEQLWRYEFDYPWAIWTKTNHLIHEDKLYVNNSQEDVTCLNPETGELIWNNPEGGPNCTDNMLYYEKEDLLVFTSWGYGSVMILDALTGETLHREHRYNDSQYNNDVVYDEERDMFFTSTYKHAIGFKVHRPK